MIRHVATADLSETQLYCILKEMDQMTEEKDQMPKEMDLMPEEKKSSTTSETIDTSIIEEQGWSSFTTETCDRKLSCRYSTQASSSS